MQVSLIKIRKALQAGYGAEALENPVQVSAPAKTRTLYSSPCETKASECKVNSYRRKMDHHWLSSLWWSIHFIFRDIPEANK